MSQIRTFLKLSALLIVSGLTACDNVEWGGMEFAIVPPAPKAAADEIAELADQTATLPQGPVLFYVRPATDRRTGTLIPVAEVAGDSMRPIGPWTDPEDSGGRFIARYMREGAEFTLFRMGRRAGTLIIESASMPSSGVCRRLPVATGNLELSGNAGDATEFLAMARVSAPDSRAAPGESLEPGRRMLVLAPILAERLMRARGAELPGNWIRARAQIQPFPVPEGQDPGYATTFLVGDTLGPGLDDQGYSLFYIGIPQAQVGYDTAYVHYTPYRTEGKAAPRVIDFLDWDRDGAVDLLLQVYGTDSAWFEAVSRVQDRWRRVLADRCETGGLLLAETVPADTTQ